jgi:hypothetical protein
MDRRWCRAATHAEGDELQRRSVQVPAEVEHVRGAIEVDSR